MMVVYLSRVTLIILSFVVFSSYLPLQKGPKRDAPRTTPVLKIEDSHGLNNSNFGCIRETESRGKEVTFLFNCSVHGGSERV